MRTRQRTASGAVASFAAAVLAVTALGTPSASAAGDELELSSATALDTKTIELRFDQPLHPELLELVTGNPNYLRNYLHVSGGVLGAGDAALDGGPLTEVTDSATWTVDVADSDALRIVLGSGATLTDRTYHVWFDGGGLPLGTDLRIRSASDAPLGGTTTPHVAFAGTTTPAALPAVAEATRLDSRTVRVEFAGPVLSGMPVARAAASGIAVGGLTPVYTQAVAATDRTTWDLTFGSDLPGGGTTLSVNGAQRALTSSAGRLTGTIDAPVAAGGDAYAPPAIATATVDQERRALRIAFTHKILTVHTGTADLPVKETNTGVSGTTLLADQVLAALGLEGSVIRESATQGVSGVVRPLSSVVSDDAAYFDGPGQLVVTLPTAYRFVRGTAGSVALADGALTDVAGVTSLPGSAPVGFVAPNAPLPLPEVDYDATGPDYLTVDRDSSVVFRHNAAEFTDAPTDYSIRQADVEDRLVDEVIPAVVVENKYIEATFVPQYGGRLLHLIYKPTGNDLLYTNPTGTQYGFTSTPPGQRGNSPFYHNWLMVWGGVFPTLTEAEHGKYWFLPWDYEVTETADGIDITMTKKDTFTYPDAPGKYTYGATEIEAQVVYSITRTSPVVGMTVSLHNPTDEAKSYEYWTCTTLAPGTDSYSGSPTMDIVTNVQQIRYDSAYSWMRSVDAPAHPETPNDRYLVLDKLKKMSEWTRDGIAYGQDMASLPQNNFWGVVNQENREGVVRVGDNTKTPGMKFWEWGQNGSFDTNIFRRGSSARPYIELWAGTSPAFFTPATLAPGATISWTETFMPTQGLADVTNATADGAAHVRFTDEGGSVLARADVFTTRIGEPVTASLVDAATGEVLATSSFVGDALVPEQLVAPVRGQSTVRLVLADEQGATLLTAEATDTSPEPTEPGPAPTDPAADYQNVSATVPATGGLSISVADHDVSLPSPVLADGPDELVSTGALNPITVVDLRASDPGWNLVGQLSDFAGPDGAVLDGRYLGVAPSVISTSPGQGVVAGDPLAPGVGLKESASLSHASAGSGRGTAVVGGGLELRVPTSTAPGTYVATLTLTAI